MARRTRDPYEALGISPQGQEPPEQKPAEPVKSPRKPKTKAKAKKTANGNGKRERLQTNVSARSFVLLHAAMLDKRKQGQRGRQVDIATCIEEAIEATYGRLLQEDQPNHGALD